MFFKQVAVCTAGAVIAAALVCGAAWAQPQALYSETAFNFGSVPSGGVITHEFKVQNTGDEDLIIRRIVSDCGCATTKSDKTIAPGQSGTIRVDFDTRGYQGHTVTRKIKVHTNSQPDPVQLEITAQVMDPVSVEPKRVSFTGRAEESLQSTVTITPSESFPLSIVATEARFGANINYTFEEKTANGQTFYQLTVYNIRQTPGRYFDEIILKTDLPAIPEVVVRVNGHILGAAE